MAMLALRALRISSNLLPQALLLFQLGKYFFLPSRLFELNVLYEETQRCKSHFTSSYLKFKISFISSFFLIKDVSMSLLFSENI